MVISVLLAVIVAVYFYTKISRGLLFLAAFILKRPLGAVIGDFLDKPLVSGGLALNRYSASVALLQFVITCVLILPQRVAIKSH